MRLFNKLFKLKSKLFYENTSVFKATNFIEKKYALTKENETPSDNSNKNSFELFKKKKDSTKSFLVNENLEIQNKKGLIELEEDLKSSFELKPLNQLKKQQEEILILLNADYKSLFNKQPTQLKNNNKNKLKANKEMENYMVIEDTEAVPIEIVKIDNDSKLLNKKRKQSDGLSGIRKEVFEK